MRRDPTLFEGYVKIGEGPWQRVCSAINEHWCRILLARRYYSRVKPVLKAVIKRGDPLPRENPTPKETAHEPSI